MKSFHFYIFLPIDFLIIFIYLYIYYQSISASICRDCDFLHFWGTLKTLFTCTKLLETGCAQESHYQYINVANSRKMPVQMQTEFKYQTDVYPVTKGNRTENLS